MPNQNMTKTTSIIKPSIIKTLFKNKRNFALSETFLILITIIFFTVESSLWVITAFLAIINLLFYIGVNLNRQVNNQENIVETNNIFKNEEINNSENTVETQNITENIIETENNNLDEQDLFSELNKISAKSKESLQSIKALENELDEIQNSLKSM